MMMAFWLLLPVLGVWWLVEQGKGSGRTASSEPLAILEERFARGEIDAEEFRNRRAAILGGSNPEHTAK
jgi:putative membrane protein